MKEIFKLKSDNKSSDGKILLTFLALFLSPLLVTHLAYALPQDPTKQTGDVTISQPNAQQLNVTQSSDKAIIDWRSFSVGVNEAVDFKLSSTNGITLNRVTGDQASSILGSLNSNGRLVLINPNGVIFGDTARVDVRGLVATTTDISNWEFMNDNFNFNLPSNNSRGVVINKGIITVSEGGLVALVAPGVSNSGTINARLGRVSLVSGNTFTLDLYGDQLINLGVNDTVMKQATGMYGEELDAQVSNSGKIYADGGIVTLKVATAQNALDQVINMDGIIQAKSISMNQEGAIILDGGDQGTVNVSGQLDASGKGWQEKGGLVRVAGKNVTLRNGARVDVSSNAGQGSAYIGGDINGNTQNSYRTLINMGSEVNADTLMDWGMAGKIVVKGTTESYGTLSAKNGTIDIPKATSKIEKIITPKSSQPEVKVEIKTKMKTKTDIKLEIKPEPKKPSTPAVASIIRNANSPAVGIGGVEVAQNFNITTPTIGIGGVDFGTRNITRAKPSGERTFNGLGGVSTTSSSNASPTSSIRSETFTPPGQASQKTQNNSESKNSKPAENISTASTSTSFTPSNLVGLGGTSLNVNIQSKSENRNQKDSQPKSALNLARSQRLKNL